MHPGQKLKRARDWHQPRLTQQDLADLIEYSHREHISNWEKTGVFPSGKLEAISRAIGIDIQWFLDGKDSYPNAQVVIVENDPATIAGFAQTAAIRSWSSAMAGFDGEDGHFELDPDPQEVPTAFLIGGTSKIDKHDSVRVTGTSMLPRIEPGDRVIFYQDQAPMTGAIALVQSPEHQVLIKAIRRDGALIRFDSLGNGACFTDLKGWKILGLAICIMGRADGSRRNIEWDDGRYLKA